MPPRVRYGIIGFGEFAGRAIGPAIMSSANSSLVALQKRSLASAREIAARTGVPHAFDSVGALVNHPDVDAVFICSANSAHHPETLAAAAAGKHVIVEKPMSLTVAEAKEMIAACDRHGVRLMVGHMVRLSPAVERVRELVGSGAYGPVVFARADFSYNARLSGRAWLFDTRVAGGGPLYDIGIHCLDTLRYVLDDEVASVKAHLDPRPTHATTETSALLSLQFSRGTPASSFCTYASPVRIRMLEVMCRDAIVSLPDFTAPAETLTVTVLKGSGGLPGDVMTERVDIPNLYSREVTLFSDAILNGTGHPLDGANGLQNMQVLEDALRQCST